MIPAGKSSIADSYAYATSGSDDGFGIVRYMPGPKPGDFRAPGSPGSSVGVGLSRSGVVKIVREIRIKSTTNGETTPDYPVLDSWFSSLASELDSGIEGNLLYRNLMITDVFLMQGKNVANYVLYTSQPTLPATGGTGTVSVFIVNPGARAGDSEPATQTLCTFTGEIKMNGVLRREISEVGSNVPIMLCRDSQDVGADLPRSIKLRFANASGGSIPEVVVRVVILGVEC